MSDERVEGHLLSDFEKLVTDNHRLMTENERLRSLLRQNNIADTVREEAAVEDSKMTSTQDRPQEESHDQVTAPHVSKQSHTEEKIALFMSLFKGRADVYARQWRGKDGKIGYSPACKNEWVPGVCGKPKAKCADCSNAAYLPYDGTAVEAHLSGRSVLGVYPLSPDDTCTFLAIDFDEESWRKDVQVVASFCTSNHIPHSVEISRSGNGAHLWFFFNGPIEAAFARKFGSQVLSMAMQEHAKLSFSSYDRMFPNQDSMPKGGFGNLIALPFQREAYRRGGSIFVDSTFGSYGDQWTFLSSIKKITKDEIEATMASWHISPLGELRPEEEASESKPWLRKEQSLSSTDFPAMVECTIADMLYISVSGISERAQNRIRRLAAFRNPQFYQWSRPQELYQAES